ncbi:hypothetical protein JVT61DRAFT_14883 [Boletus reticuloceps]|uniref:Uncharacterized protein n=1 Tax=Boletus reticuloceps TaxID=495285 RepID=A0A8I3A291_9AGAM|nr:hypothetical protein JVT61DRAFT_14883 [Boletus reticuloceps]
MERFNPALPEDFEILEVNCTQSLQRIKCPNAWCNREFRSIHAITEHLNSPEESLWSEPQPQEQSHLRLPPSLRQHRGGTASDTRTAQYHPLSGETYGKSKNLFQQMEDNPNHKHRIQNAYYPFTGAAEWTLAKFLAENLTQAQINRFLKLRWFRENTKPSFSSAEQLLGWIDILPTTSTWQTVQLEIQGYPTTSPIQLIWRDALETVKSIVSNPVFASNITFDPIKIRQNNVREYGEWFTSQEAFRIQVRLTNNC